MSVSIAKQQTATLQNPHVLRLARIEGNVLEVSIIQHVTALSNSMRDERAKFKLITAMLFTCQFVTERKLDIAVVILGENNAIA